MLPSIYLLVMLVPGFFLLISFFLGEIFDWVGEIGEGALGLLESALEALPFIGDVDLTPEGVEGEKMGFGMFRALLVFATFFGAGGYLASATFPDLHVGWTVAVSLVAGLIGFIPSFFIFGQLAKMEANSAPALALMVGMTGTVTVSIEAGHPGQIELATSVGLFRQTARAADSISRGARVEVVSVEGSVVSVRQVSATE